MKPVIKKPDLQQAEFEKLVKEYIECRNNAGFHLLKLALVVLEANTKLNRRLWKSWIKDTRVKLKFTQAKKLIAVAKACQNRGQLTDLLNREGVEKTYCLTRISSPEKQEMLAEQIIDAEFTVPKVKMAVDKVEKENKTPSQAVEEVRRQANQPKPKTEKKPFSVEDFNRLKAENETLKKANAELERKLAALQQRPAEKPVQSLQEIAGQQSMDLSYLN